MKKIKLISILLVLALMLSACGGKENTKEPAAPSDPGTVSTDGPSTDPAAPQTPSQGSTQPVAPSTASDPTDQTLTPYERLVGTWVAVEGETEGYHYDALDENIYVKVEFMPNHVAIYTEESLQGETTREIYYGVMPEDGTLYGSGEDWHMDLKDSEYLIQKSVTIDNGQLIMDLSGDYTMGGTLFLKKVEAPLLAEVMVMEANSINTASDGSYLADDMWFPNVVDSIILPPVDLSATVYWQLFTAQEDGVTITLESAYPNGDYLSMIFREEAAFVKSEQIYTITLSKGETLAVKASEPWYPEYRASVLKDNFWGEFRFETHKEVKDGAFHAAQLGTAYFVTGHDKELEYCSIRSASGSEACRFLEGVWTYMDDSGALKAVMVLDHSGGMTVFTDEKTYELSYYMDRVFSGEFDPADTICLWGWETSQVYTDFGVSEGLGDYYFELHPVDGEEILSVVQINNGDGFLDDMVGYPDEYYLVFHRYEGAPHKYKLASGTQFIGQIVKYDLDNWKVWIQPMTVLDHAEDGSPIYGRSTDVIVPYEPLNAEVLSPIFTCSNIEYPMLLCNITIDANGKLSGIEEYFLVGYSK